MAAPTARKSHALAAQYQRRPARRDGFLIDVDGKEIAGMIIRQRANQGCGGARVSPATHGDGMGVGDSTRGCRSLLPPASSPLGSRRDEKRRMDRRGNRCSEIESAAIDGVDRHSCFVGRDGVEAILHCPLSEKNPPGPQEDRQQEMPPHVPSVAGPRETSSRPTQISDPRLCTEMPRAFRRSRWTFSRAWKSSRWRAAGGDQKTSAMAQPRG